MKNRFRRGKKKIKFLILGFFLLFLAVAGMAIAKSCKLENIEIYGNSRYTAAEMEQLLVTEPTDSITFLFWLRGRLEGFQSIPFIEKVEVDMAGRNSVLVTVHEKRVTGCVEQMGSYLYFDREGIIVESTKEHFKDIPLVTGLKFSKVVQGEKMEVQREGLFQTILNLARLIEKQELDVSEINFNMDYEITLFTEGCEVLLGKKENYDEEMAILKSVLNSSQGRKLKIDMTGGRITALSLEEQE